MSFHSVCSALEEQRPSGGKHFVPTESSNAGSLGRGRPPAREVGDPLTPAHGSAGFPWVSVSRLLRWCEGNVLACGRLPTRPPALEPAALGPAALRGAGARPVLRGRDRLEREPEARLLAVVLRTEGYPVLASPSAQESPWKQQ